MQHLNLFNTRTHTLEPFTPQDPKRVTMYVCGPTVYNTPHIGNIRPSVIFDVLFKLLKTYYANVVYIHNITDIDDKVIARARQLGVSIEEVARTVEKEYKTYLQKLHVALPTAMPRATEHIPSIIAMIKALIENNHAYVHKGNVFFHVPSYKQYGALARKNLNELYTNVRINVQDGKKNPADFTLWKPSLPSEPSWESPWGLGRPGWHIECSAMIHEHLGSSIDIHGGGVDLTFPHHENEIAQSVCYTHKECLARFFLHNGHITHNGAKMSKTLGNTILLDSLMTQNTPAVIRTALLMVHYRQPLNWCDSLLQQARNIWKKIAHNLPKEPTTSSAPLSQDFMQALNKDLNTPLALRALMQDIKQAQSPKHTAQHCALLGLPTYQSATPKPRIDTQKIEALMQERLAAKKARDFQTSDAIRQELATYNIKIHDHPDGTSSWSHHEK